MAHSLTLEGQFYFPFHRELVHHKRRSEGGPRCAEHLPFDDSFRTQFSVGFCSDGYTEWGISCARFLVWRKRHFPLGAKLCWLVAESGNGGYKAGGILPSSFTGAVSSSIHTGFCRIASLSPL
ncbi:hypothetical protein BIW11_02694 [Tropilaelaps mercedesae]|uniref:Uncharacterized protein n=1 Tax=Tropilaelaps mercedesae TaxID=418985 RepID=A0A1V9XYQ7_9ACAR|nr:hypothetical protein BIW11_02694 [Tropilaelaps mercedesae]